MKQTTSYLISSYAVEMKPHDIISARRHHINYKNTITKIPLYLILLIKLLAFVSASSLIAPTCKAENQLAYINKGSNEQPKPLMRAWMCHGKTHKEMVDKLVQAGIVKSQINKQALLSVDRGNYVLRRSRDYAYEDAPQPIGYSATISAPHMHAHVLEDLLPPLIKASKNQPDKPLSILDVGCGSGYLTAVFGRMVEPKENRKIPPFSPEDFVAGVENASTSTLNPGKVYGIDVIPQLVDMTRANIQKEDGDLFDSNTVDVLVADGWKGHPEGSPYNAIHVGAAAATFPRDLMMQLAVDGVMVIPVGPDGGTQYLYHVKRVADSGGWNEEDYEVRRVLGVRYVPLVRTD